MTIATLAFYFLENVHMIKRWSFRLLTFGILLSIIFDIIWLVLNQTSWWRSAPYDGDLEKGLRRYSIVMTYISLVFRLIVLLTYWKASVDYNTIIGDTKKKLGYGFDPNNDRLTFSNMFLNAKKQGFFRRTTAA